MLTQKSVAGHRTNGKQNLLHASDRAAHDWYRFVLSYPPHLVREYLDRFGIGARQQVLDPFCGTGTTLVECKKLGIPSVGLEANPMASFASRVKVDWSPDPDSLLAHAQEVAEAALEELRSQGIDDEFFFSSPQKPTCHLLSLPPEQEKLLLKGSISPLPLHKTLVLLKHLDLLRDERFDAHERVALAKALVDTISNLHFGPEVGVGPAKKDAPVVGSWLERVSGIAADLRELASVESAGPTSFVVRPSGRPLEPGIRAEARTTNVYQADAREADRLLDACSMDAVITSPPYPNEKDYTRTTRLESVLLGLIRDKAGLRAMKQGLVRSNTRTVFVKDDDDRWVANNPEVQRIAAAIEARRIELGKTSGFERLYPRATKLYFGGMARHLAGLRAVLRPGAHLAYVVGDQASYLRVMIRTGQILAGIAESLGYEVESIDLFRTRLATATREQIREEVVVLRWRP